MSLVLYLGPMCAGKTGELLRCLECSALAGVPVLGVGSRVDTRSEEAFSPRKGRGEVTYPTVKVDRLSEVDASAADVIGVDEGQFFPDLHEQVEKWVDGGKHVIVSGLNGTYLRTPFGQIHLLIPLADEVHLLRAVCSICARSHVHTPAIFSARISTSSEEVVVGGAEAYLPVCRKHYLTRT